MNHKLLQKLLVLLTAACALSSMVLPLGAAAIAAPGGQVPNIPLNYMDEEYAKKGSDADGAIPVPDVFENVSNKTIKLDQNSRVTEWPEWTDPKPKDDAAFKFGLAENAAAATDLAAAVFDGGTNDNARKNIVGKTVLISLDMATSAIDSNIKTKGLSAAIFYDSAGSAVWPQLLNFEPNGKLTFDLFKTDITYEAKTWYHFAFEIQQDSNTYKAWIDGTPVLQADGSAELKMASKAGQTTVTGLRVVRGLIKSVSGQKGDLFMDNLSVTVDGKYSEDWYSSQRDASSLSFYKDMALLNTDIDNITSDLNLPTAGENGSTISWTSSDDSVINDRGIITPDLVEAKPVTLTATITKGGAVNTKVFNVTVAKKTVEAPELEEALAAIDFDLIRLDNASPDRVISNLNLPATGLHNAEINWLTSDSAAISTEGVVTRYAEAGRAVRLTAKVTANGKEGAKSIDVVVPGDYVLNDSCVNFDLTTGKSTNLTVAEEAKLGISGFRIDNPTPLAGQYVTYSAAPGDRFKVSAIISGAPQDITFETNTGSTVSATRSEPIAMLGSADGWYRYDYVSDQPLPAGATGLKINLGTPANHTSCYITGVRLYEDGELTFDDIRGGNDSMDEILSDLDLSDPDTEFTSRNTDVLANDGAVTRPDEDTIVRLQAVTQNAGVETVKIYALNIRSKAYVNPADDLGFREGEDAEFIDDFADFSNLYDSAPIHADDDTSWSFGIKHWPMEAVGLEHGVSQTAMGAGAWLTYKMEGDITGFRLDSYFSKRNGLFAEDMQFEISATGEEGSWRRLSYEAGEVTASEKGLKVNPWHTATFTGEGLPAGTRYFKIIFGDNTQHGLRYAVLLEKITLYSKDDVSRAVASLDVADYCQEPIDQVVTDIALPDVYDNGTTVTWTSGMPEILTNSGEIQQDNFIDYSYPVTLEAVISKRGFTKAKKTFEVVIHKDVSGFNDMDYVDYDLSKITFEGMTDQVREQVVDSIFLPASPAGGSTFVWTASSPVAQIVDGFAKFTPADMSETELKLILTATHNGATKTKEFPLTVIRGFGDNKLLEAKSVEASSGSIQQALSRSFRSFWETTKNDKKPVVLIEFESTVKVNGGLLVERGNNMTSFKLEASDDGRTWAPLFDGTAANAGDRKREVFLFDEAEARQFRFTFEKPADALLSLYTIELYYGFFSPDQGLDMSLSKLKVPATTKENLTLPKTGEPGVTISWSSSDPNVISNDGVIYKTTGANRSATLTATATLDGKSKSRTFPPTTVINDIVTGGGSSGGSGGGGGGNNGGGSGMTYTPPVNLPPVQPVEPPTVFGDVADSHWAYSYIFRLKELGVVSEAERFRPDDSITREEFLKMLLLGAGIPAAEAETGFSDVSPDAWYAGYVAAANQLGIVNGMGDGSFGIGRAVSREDIAVMTARVLDQQGKLAEPEAALSFHDSDAISAYAKAAVGSLTQMKILNGLENNEFAPNASATRAETAKIICLVNETLSQQEK